MARLSIPPNFIGTPSSDTLVGEELNGTPAIGIDILTGGYIRTLSGKDTITGTGQGGDSVSEGEGSSGENNLENGADGTGIVNGGSLNTGKGKDTITGIGTGGNGSISLGNGGEGGSGIGIANSGSLNTGNGGSGTGISNSGKLDTGEEEDTIFGTGIGGVGGIGTSGNGNGGAGIGIQNIKDATITTGWGNDTITGYGNSAGTNNYSTTLPKHEKMSNQNSVWK